MIGRKLAAYPALLEMIITATVDRIEYGKAILVTDEAGIEISIPAEIIENSYKKGETLSLNIDRDGNIKSLN